MKYIVPLAFVVPRALKFKQINAMGLQIGFKRRSVDNSVDSVVELIHGKHLTFLLTRKLILNLQASILYN